MSGGTTGVMVQTLLVINPNASSAVTQAIDDAIAPLGHAHTAIEVVGLAGGPPGIETNRASDHPHRPGAQ
jgi:Asp/Glu/hydantoin racemase